MLQNSKNQRKHRYIVVSIVHMSYYIISLQILKQFILCVIVCYCCQLKVLKLLIFFPVFFNSEYLHYFLTTHNRAKSLFPSRLEQSILFMTASSHKTSSKKLITFVFIFFTCTSKINLKRRLVDWVLSSAL